MARRARLIRWGAVGLLAAATAAYVLIGRERSIPVGVAVPNLISGPMTPSEAHVLLNTVVATAQVEEHNGEVVVRLGTATFPQRREGQLAFAQQYARADEIVQGAKRQISFIDPAGISFAKASPDQGVVMTR